MKNRAKRTAAGENIAFVLAIFILFLLAFESRLEIPLWLQPVGRMHPLILHFPIALILIAMALEFFRSKSRTDYSRKFYRDFTGYLLLAGIILTGITIVMGMFLAREQVYEPSGLSWHKWTSVIVFFLSVGVYSCRKFGWYGNGAAKAGAVITSLVMIVTGYLGGAITHGENFVLQPVIPEEKPLIVSLEEANVFGHVIHPILESKCLSCHSKEKRKGELLLADTMGIMRGGKTGPLYVPGDPQASLILQRLHLPADDKKHMPPSDRTQLTKDEISLIYYWIKSGAGFTRHVTGLPEGDTLRMIATRVFESGKETQERYPFPPVAEGTLEKLNSNYRVIRPVAINSPALTVNIYNRDVYTPKTLDELKDVKMQVVSLDVAKMPVTDKELEYISRFENLRKLNLNFTNISGSRLGLLHKLENLSALSLSGTAVKYQDVRKSLPGFKNLKTLAIWDTDITSSEIQQLQEEFINLDILGTSVEEGMLIKLNPPRLKNKIRVFDDSISLELFHAVNGVDIRYTLDGNEPDSLTSPSFQGNTIINESKAINARAYKGGWLSSDVSTLNVYRSSLKPDTAILLTKLNRVHPANGAKTFFDHQLGSFNANSPAWANNWAGFLRNDMELLLHYRAPAAVKSVYLNMLIEIETSIFPPATIEVWGGDTPETLRLITRKKITLPDVYKKPYIELIGSEFEEQRVSYLKIVARPVMSLPEWHKNKNKPALLLIDEILIN